MNADSHRDRALDQALKAAYSRGADAPITPACLDAETLAAWSDGGLDAQAVAMAEAHASNCARCQDMLGTLVRATPVVTAGASSPVPLWRWWFAPLAAGAAAVTLWMVVPTDRYTAPAPTKEIQFEAPPAAAQAPNAARDAVAAESPRSQPDGKASTKNRQADRKLADNAVRENVAVTAADESKPKIEALMKADKASERRDRAERAPAGQGLTQPAARAAAPPPAAPAAPTAAAIGAVQGQIALPSDVQITSTSSPTPGVKWFVGRAGVVLLTIDGRKVTRLSFPETTDLTAVTATDASNAVVTTIDGRIFRTENGGASWRQQ